MWSRRTYIPKQLPLIYCIVKIINVINNEIIENSICIISNSKRNN